MRRSLVSGPVARAPHRGRPGQQGRQNAAGSGRPCSGRGRLPAPRTKPPARPTRSADRPAPGPTSCELVRAIAPVTTALSSRAGGTSIGITAWRVGMPPAVLEPSSRSGERQRGRRLTAPDQGRERYCTKRGDRLTEDQEPSPVPAVGKDPGRNGEEHRGQPAHGNRDAHSGRRLGELQHQPGERHVRHPLVEEDQCGAQPVETKLAIAQ